jgi:regulator of RNase E activity RraA
MKRGAAGIVTDGGFRDTPAIAALAIPAYHARPAAPTNLIRHHAVDLDVPIGCGEVAVYPRDIVVGDNEGVVVIPAHLANAVAEEAYEMTAFEDFVMERVEAGQSIVGLYPPTDPRTLAAFAEWRARNGR